LRRPFSKGVGGYFAALSDPEAVVGDKADAVGGGDSGQSQSVFGVVAAWAIAKFEFPGKTFLISLIDLPFSVSPGDLRPCLRAAVRRAGFWGPWLQAHHIHVLFRCRGIALATIFVTFPFVARALIPLMQEQGTLEEEAASRSVASGLPDVLPRHAAEHQMGCAVRRAALQRAAMANSARYR